MNYYETVYIIHPALQEGRLNDIVEKIHNKLEELTGKILYVNSEDKLKLILYSSFIILFNFVWRIPLSYRLGIDR